MAVLGTSLGEGFLGAGRGGEGPTQALPPAFDLVVASKFCVFRQTFGHLLSTYYIQESEAWAERTQSLVEDPGTRTMLGSAYGGLRGLREGL